MITLSSRCRGVHERFIASEGIDDVLFDTVDEIVPVHVAGRGNVRALGQNEKPNGPKEKLQSPSNLYETSRSRGPHRSRKGLLTAKADVRTFHKPAVL
jgi:hypothetical protein